MDIPNPMGSPENVHASNIMQIEQALFRYISLYTYITITIISEKRP